MNTQDDHGVPSVAEIFTAHEADRRTGNTFGQAVVDFVGEELPFLVRVAAGKAVKAVAERWRDAGSSSDVSDLARLFPETKARPATEFLGAPLAAIPPDVKRNDGQEGLRPVESSLIDGRAAASITVGPVVGIDVVLTYADGATRRIVATAPLANHIVIDMSPEDCDVLQLRAMDWIQSPVEVTPWPG